MENENKQKEESSQLLYKRIQSINMGDYKKKPVAIVGKIRCPKGDSFILECAENSRIEVVNFDQSA